MKIRDLDIGVESISRWRQIDETHLPVEGELKPEFSFRTKELDAILRPPTLDERLQGMLAPDGLDAELLRPAVMAETKAEILAMLRAAALTGDARMAATMAAAAKDLEDNLDMDREIASALVTLYRG